jgi:O-antigen/teichoic acid export membrane protein
VSLPVNQPPKGRTERFVLNVAWNWAGVTISLITGFLLSPYMFRKLEPEGYGIWALAFSLVEYYWLLDLGIRSATVKYVAHYWAKEEPGNISAVMSTAVSYSCLIAVFMMGVVTLATPYMEMFFHISARYHDSFRKIVMLTTLGWCLGLVFNLFSAAIEAVQRFDVTNRIAIITTGARAIAWAGTLYLGYGIVPLGIATVLSQCLMYALNFYYFRRVLPQCRISPQLAGIPMLKRMWGFGIHTFVQTVSTMGLNQGPPILIAHFLPTAFVGFYNMPIKLLQYTVDFVGRIGLVTNANAAELAARGESERLSKLAIYTNRYCLVIFMPFAILLWTHGSQFFRIWMGAEGAKQAAPLLPILLLGNVFAVVAQFSSSMLLQGLGRHQRYAKGLLIEAVLTVAVLWMVIPRWGIIGAAWTCSVLMILNRGFLAPWLVSKTLSIPFGHYMGSIYVRPLLAAAPVLAIAYALHATVLPGTNLVQVFAVGAIIGSVYYGIAFPLCLDHGHRAMVIAWLNRKRNRLGQSTSTPIA